jgi:hypothetical protein
MIDEAGRQQFKPAVSPNVARHQDSQEYKERNQGGWNESEPRYEEQGLYGGFGNVECIGCEWRRSDRPMMKPVEPFIQETMVHNAMRPIESGIVGNHEKEHKSRYLERVICRD